MHFSPIRIGVTALFILSRLAAASSDRVDVGAAPANHGQLKPVHSRFAPHHRHEGGEKTFASHYHRHRLTDDYYPSKEKRTWSGASIQAAAAKKAQADALGSKLRQLEALRPCPTTFGATDNRVKALFGRQWSGAGNRAAAARQAQANAMRSKLRQLEAPRPRPTTFRATDNRAKALFGCAHKVNANAVMQAEQRNSALQKQINALQMQQKMTTQGIPRGGGRRVGQQYASPESFNPRAISALGG